MHSQVLYLIAAVIVVGGLAALALLAASKLGELSRSRRAGRQAR